MEGQPRTANKFEQDIDIDIDKGCIFCKNVSQCTNITICKKFEIMHYYNYDS